MAAVQPCTACVCVLVTPVKGVTQVFEVTFPFTYIRGTPQSVKFPEIGWGDALAMLLELDWGYGSRKHGGLYVLDVDMIMDSYADLPYCGK